LGLGMAKLSKLSQRLRRCFEVENPQAAQLDDALLEYLAHTLEDDEASEDELVETWSPFVLGSAALDDEGSTSELCRAVLKRIRGLGNLGRASSGSGTDSPVDPPVGDSSAAQGSLERTPSTSSARRDPKEAEVRGLEEWLDTTRPPRDCGVRAWVQPMSTRSSRAGRSSAMICD